MSIFPYYLAIGMSYELFWDGDPRLVKAYREAHELKTQMKNQEMWVQGIYNYHGIRTVAESVIYGISGGKGAKPKNYPSEPLPITKAEQEAATERNKQRTLAWVEANQ